MGDRPVTRVRRITLRGGVVLETGDGRRRLITPVPCRVCERTVTADGDRNHEIEVPTVAGVDVEMSVVVVSCHGRQVAGRVTC